MNTTTRIRIPALALLFTLIWPVGGSIEPPAHAVDASARTPEQAPITQPVATRPPTVTAAPTTSAFAPDLATPAKPEETERPLTAEQQDLLDWARSRFKEAGLDLPHVNVYFHGEALDCHGHVGLYYRGSNSVHMCRLDKYTMLHELAHAWANQALDNGDRYAFLRHRDLQAWNDHDEDWSQRGTEHAAETIAWALMDRNLLVPDLREDGSGTFHRLLSIPDSEPEQLIAAYQLLTGTDPAFRNSTEWQSHAETTSPEAARHSH